jgi:hypothetical protein
VQHLIPLSIVLSKVKRNAVIFLYTIEEEKQKKRKEKNKKKTNKTNKQKTVNIYICIHILRKKNKQITPMHG